MPYTFETDRLIIQTSDTALDEKMLKYYSDNREFFEQYELGLTDKE